MPHRIHCILIDDDPAVLSPMQNILHQSAQFHVDKCFTSIENALAYLQTHQPDLIISDIEFPQQDLAYYRLKEFPDNIPLCLISGYPVYVAQSYPFLRDKASTIGILTKPFTPALMQVLETLYNQYKQRQERQQQDSYQTEQLIRAANEHKLKLFKLKDNQSIVPVGIPIANIIMAFPNRTFRGLTVYCRYFPKPFVLPNTTLKECFEDIESRCPGLCIPIGRSGIANLLNVTTECDTIIPQNRNYATTKLSLPIPVRLQRDIKEKIQQFEKRLTQYKETKRQRQEELL